LQFLGVLGQIIVLHVPKTDILVLKINVLLFLGHGAADIYFVASPQNSKTFIFKTRMSVFGTIITMISFCCIPSKQQNFYFQNKNVSFRDNNHNDIILLHPLKTAKLLFRKQESMV
jgi:hypothetical protein